MSSSGPVRPRAAAASAGADAPPVVEHLPEPWAPGNVIPSLPIGIAILAVLIAILGVVTLLAGALFLLNAYAGNVVPLTLLIVRSVDPLGAAILVLLGAILLAVATSLWRQETWALWTTIVVVFLTLAYLFFTDSITVLFVLFLLLFMYLFSVRRHFY
jgi:hypothetical protein